MSDDGLKPRKVRARRRTVAVQAETDIKSRIRIFVELFSVATGISFLVSAILHMAVFAAWGLDFTAVASVEDVIMGGIRLLVIAAIAALLFGFLGFVRHLLQAELLSKPASGRWRRRLFMGLAMLFVVVVYAAPLGAPRLGTISIIWVAGALAYVVGLLAILIYTSPISIREAIALGPGPVRALLAQSGLVAAVLTLYLLYGGYANLAIEPTSLLTAPCQREHRVLWIGSRGIIVTCPTGVYAVIRNDVPLLLRVKS
ncbi:MAG TPA: hypothetical protein VEW71_05680 [Allosphingosinicella sp.]|nr:hypothetical protein [Allosphingosinicella sp.]